MNKNTFERVVEDTLDMCKAVLTRKSGEYSSSEDKLHNFDKAKDLMRCKTKEFALLGMLNKHLVSVIDMIVKYEQEEILPSAKLVNEKIGDSINYFVLLKACFMEDIYNKENDKISDYTVGDIRNIREQIKKTDEGNLCEFCANADRICLIKENLGMKIAECKAFIDVKTEKARKEFAKAIRENPDKWIKMRKEIEQFEAQKPMDINEVWKQQQAAMANSNNDKQDVETLKKEQALIANSLWNNARKRLVVEKLRTMLKPMFIYLTDNNKFIDYEGIKSILNRAELERDSVPDDFIYDVIVAIEQLDLVSAEGYQKRDETITNVIQIMLQPKYKIGDKVWTVIESLLCKDCKPFGMIIDNYFLFPDDKEIGYKSLFGETVYEKDCFATKEEAEKECERRNKEIEKGSAKE